jgi:ABC-type polar amino acid transport system ATPase subunit
MSDPIIICRDVHKWFDDFQALRGINMEVEKGEVIVIFGPSGSGKSTFIRTINRLEEHQLSTVSNLPTMYVTSPKSAARLAWYSNRSTCSLTSLYDKTSP